jgi:hypothetical protein
MIDRSGRLNAAGLGLVEREKAGGLGHHSRRPESALIAVRFVTPALMPEQCGAKMIAQHWGLPHGRPLKKQRPSVLVVVREYHLCNLLFTLILSAVKTGANMLREEINWQPRPRKLMEFTADTQVRLRQLDFNRTITVYGEDKALRVRRTGLNRFLWCEAAA